MAEPARHRLSRRELLRLSALAAAYVACQPAGPPAAAQRTPGGTIRIAIGIDPDTLDPAGQTTTTVQNIVDYVVETLVVLDESGKPQPLLAEKWESSADGKSYTFTLRKGATFHDGTPFNAKAVKTSLDRFLNPSLKVSLRAPIGEVTDRIEVIDDNTVRFTLKRVFSPFVDALTGTQTAIVSPATAEKFATTYNEEPVGTGPYVFKSRQKGESVTLARNDKYWGKKPFYDTVQIRVVPEAATRESLLLAGQAEVIILPPIADIPTLQKNPQVKVIAGASDRTIFLAFNHTREVMKDPRVRQALNYAIDKDAIIKNVLFGLGERMDAPMAPALFGYCKVGGYDYDPAKARDLLKQAGQEKLSIKMGYPTGRYVQDQQVGQAIAGYFREAGITVDATTSDWPSYLGSINVPPEKAAFDVHLLGWAPGYMDASQQFEQFAGKTRWPPAALATSYYDNPKVTDLNARAASEPDRQKRAGLYCDASKIVWDDAPWAFLWVQRFPIVHSTKIKNVTSLPSEKFYAVYAEPA
jgi:peptide/nickel transport system substrate-binding protein